MALTYLDITVIVLFLVAFLYIGIHFRGKAGNSLTDFFLGGRGLPWYIAGMSMVATTFAADTPLAVSEMVAESGISKNWLWWSFLTGGMLTTFFFADLWRRANILTELEFIDIRYSGRSARFLRGFKAVYLGVFMNCMILGWVNLAFNSLLTAFFGVPEQQVIFFTGAAMLLALSYSSVSGLLGIAITDAFQFIVALTGTVILAFLVVNSEDVGGISELQGTLPNAYFDYFPSLSNNGLDATHTLTLSVGAFLSYIGIQWWSSWYPGAEPGGGGYIVQRMMSTRTEKDSVLASLFFQITHYCLRPWPWIVVGLCAIMLYDPGIALDNPALEQKVLELKEQGVPLQELDQHIPALAEAGEGSKLQQAAHYTYNPRLGYVFAMKDFLPSGLRGLLLVAFIAAYMSTVSTHLNWGASYLVNDLYLPYLSKRKKDDRAQVRISRIVTVGIMALSLVITTQITSISGVWEFILECGAGLGLVLILRWYWWRINAWSEITATIIPFIAYGIGKLLLEPQLGAGFVENRGTFYFTVGITTIAWLLVTYITPAVDRDKLKSFYSRVRPDGAWEKVARDMGEQGESNSLGGLLVCWISSVALVYSVLFLTGDLILGRYGSAFIYGGSALAAFLVLRYAMGHTRIFRREE